MTRAHEVALDDVERDRFRSSPLVGDDAVEGDLALPVQRITSVAARSGTPLAPDATMSLDGEWLLRGAAPGQRFGIERWAGVGASAAGPDWQREDTDRGAWTPATVPGTVQGALVAAGSIADPLMGSNTYDELVRDGEPSDWPWHYRRTEIERQEWWFARRFRVPGEWRGRAVRVEFDGIDLSATVFLNGETIARHTGMYGGPDVEIGGLLRFGAENELVVRIDPPPHDWHGVMKASPGWGWHYGHLISIGIWRSVRLRLLPAVEVRHPQVTTMSIDGGSARLRVRADVLAADPEPGELPVLIEVRDPDGAPVLRCTSAVHPGAGRVRFETELVLPDPQVWWPFGYGDQPTYSISIACADGVVATEFGVRTVEMLALPDWTGEQYYRWRFVVNGRPLFLKGANWCWTDPMGTRPDDVDRHLLALTRHAGLQMLRAWGGGIVESEGFYAECDRLGILVYQEFPLSFGLPDATRVDLGVIDRQVTRIVRSLRNHPSLVMWGGGNENELNPAGDEVLTLIGKRVTALDDSRPFHRTDPWGGSVHNYVVYHEGRRIDEGYATTDGAVWGEFGLSSQCAIESMSGFLDPELLAAWPPPADGAILQHQSQFSLVDLVKQLRYADYGPVRDWRTLIEHSQIAQGEALRFAAERVRAGSGTHTGAYWFYKVGEVFPGASWAVIDFFGRPKRSYYLARRFSAPVSAFAVTERLEFRAGERFEAEVHVANDTVSPLLGSVTATVWDARLTKVVERSAQVDVPSDGRVTAFVIDEPAPGDGAPFLLSVRLTVGGADVHDQWYWFNARARTDRIVGLEAVPMDDLWHRDMTEFFDAYAEERPAPLLELPTTEVRLETGTDAVTVTNVGTVPAPLVLIDGFRHGPGVLLEDDAFGLAPGQTRRIAVTGADPRTMPLSVSGWNVAGSVGPSAARQDEPRPPGSRR